MYYLGKRNDGNTIIIYIFNVSFILYLYPNILSFEISYIYNLWTMYFCIEKLQKNIKF